MNNIKDFFQTYSLFIAPIITLLMGVLGVLLGAYIAFRLERYRRRKDWYAIYLEPIERFVDRILNTCSEVTLALSLKALPDLLKSTLTILSELLVALPYIYKAGDKKLSKLVGKFYFDTFALLEAIDIFLFNNKLINEEIFRVREEAYKNSRSGMAPKMRKSVEKKVRNLLHSLEKDYKKYSNEKIGLNKILNKHMETTLRIYKRIIKLKV